MNDVKITKAKIKNGIFLDVDYSETLPGHAKKSSSTSCTVPVHEDLINAFQFLDKHLAVLFNAVPVTSGDRYNEVPMPSNYKAKGFTISGMDESEKVIITGTMETEYGTANINTPGQKFATSEYPLIKDLAEHVAACVYEVEQYLFKAKRAPEEQLALDFEEPETVEEEQ
jgi:hypothetical protein